MDKISKLKLVLFVSALLFAFNLSGCKENIEKPIEVMPAPLVGVMRIEQGNIPIKSDYVGITEGSEAIEVRSQVSGILKSRDYIEGSYVLKEAPLFHIEDASYKAALLQAESNYAQANAKFVQSRENFKRVSGLFSKNAVSRMDYDNAKGDYDSAVAAAKAAQASVTEASVRLGYTVIRSPVSGYAGKANMSVGNLVSATSADGNLLTFVNKVDPIYVNFFIPDPEYASMKALESEGKLVMTEPYAEMTYFNSMKFPYKGTINFVDKAVNRTTGNVNVRAGFPNDNITVMPGQFVIVTVSGSYLKDVILIPQEALIKTAAGSMVIVVDDKKIASYRPIEIGENINGKFLLIKGVKSGEMIVTKGTNKVRPNSAVEIEIDKPEGR